MRVNLKQTEDIFPIPVLMVATYNDNVSVMKRIISSIDPKALIVINEVRSVLGKGYTIDRY